MSRMGFPKHVAQNIVDLGVDGDLLLQLEDKSLKEDLCITNGIQRKRFLRELSSLKKDADYSCVDGEDIQDFLVNSVGPEYKVYTYNFVKNDLSLSLIRRLSASDLDDMLKEASITSSIHRRKIVEAVCDDSAEEYSVCSSMAGSLVECPISISGEVFISFDKTVSAELASLIRMQLQIRGFVVHMADNAKSHDVVLDTIRSTRNFVVVLSKGTLDSCIGDTGKKVHLHREVAAALDSHCNIIPVFDDFVFPETDSLPEDIRTLCFFNGVRWVHDYQDACLDKIERFITGSDSAASSRNGSLSRVAMGIKKRRESGRSTPVGMMRRRTCSQESGVFVQQIN